MTARQLKAKKYLEQYEEALRKVRWCQEQYARELYLTDAIRSPSNNDGMPHGSGISKPTENKAIRLAEKALDLHTATQAAKQTMREVFAVAYNVGGIEGDIIIERYIKLKDWRDVYKAVNYATSQAHRYHRAGLDKVADIIGV